MGMLTMKIIFRFLSIQFFTALSREAISDFRPALEVSSLVQRSLQLNQLKTKEELSSRMFSAMLSKHQQRIDKLMSNEKFWDIFRDQKKSNGFMTLMRQYDRNLAAHVLHRVRPRRHVEPKESVEDIGERGKQVRANEFLKKRATEIAYEK